MKLGKISAAVVTAAIAASIGITAMAGTPFKDVKIGDTATRIEMEDMDIDAYFSKGESLEEKRLYRPEVEGFVQEALGLRNGEHNYAISGIFPGDWAEYTVEILSSATYNIKFVGSGGVKATGIALFIDGERFYEGKIFNNEYSENNEIEIGDFYFEEGTRVFKWLLFGAEGDDLKMDAVVLTLTDDTQIPVAQVVEDEEIVEEVTTEIVEDTEIASGQTVAVPIAQAVSENQKDAIITADISAATLNLLVVLFILSASLATIFMMKRKAR